jgi:hypothetical protein
MAFFKRRRSWWVFGVLAVVMFLLGGLAYPPGRHPIWWEVVGILVAGTLAFFVARLTD